MENNVSSLIPEALPEALPAGYILKGNILEEKHNEYTILKYLGEGYTATVYLAQSQQTSQGVAIKVLKPGLPELTRQKFRDESFTIAQILNSGATTVPQVFEYVEYDQTPFMVMEYVDGEHFQSLSSMLEKGRIVEKTVLEITAQTLDLLDRFHTRVERTYTDMQLKNFWWNDTEKILKVMDWGHVSPKRQALRAEELGGLQALTPEEVQQLKTLEKEPDADSNLVVQNLRQKGFQKLIRNDLALFASFFYQMLTAKGTSPTGEERRKLEDRAGIGWQEISLATRQIIWKALHLNPERRYASAKEWLEDIREVQTLWAWERGNETVLKEFQMAMSQALNETSERTVVEQALDQATRLLDMMIRQGTLSEDRASFYRKRLETVGGNISAQWATGWNFYRARYYPDALRYWEEEVPVLGRLDLWRWLLLARTGSQLAVDFEPLRSELEKIIQALQNDQLMQAEAGFIQIYPNLKEQFEMFRENVDQEVVDKALLSILAPLRPLIWEICLRRQIERAKGLENRPAHWRDAIAIYEHIENLLREGRVLPYVSQLREELRWTELPAWASFLKEQLALRELIESGLGELQENLRENFKEELKIFTRDLQKDPSHPGLIALAINWEGKSFSETFELVAVAHLYSAPEAGSAERLDNRYRELRARWMQYQQMKAYEAWYEDFEKAYEPKAWPALQALALKKPVVPPAQIPEKARQKMDALQENLAQDFAAFIESKNLPAAQEVYNVLDALKVAKEAQQGQLKTLKADLENDVDLFARLQQEIDTQQANIKALEGEIARNHTEIEALKQNYQQKNIALEETYQQKLESLEKMEREAFARQQRQQAFIDWTDERGRNLSALKAQLPVDQWSNLLAQLDQDLDEASRAYSDLTNTELFQNWKTSQETLRNEWHIHLNVILSIHQALQDVGELLPETVWNAETKLQKAAQALTALTEAQRQLQSGQNARKLLNDTQQFIQGIKDSNLPREVQTLDAFLFAIVSNRTQPDLGKLEARLKNVNKLVKQVVGTAPERFRAREDNFPIVADLQQRIEQLKGKKSLWPPKHPAPTEEQLYQAALETSQSLRPGSTARLWPIPFVVKQAIKPTPQFWVPYIVVAIFMGCGLFFGGGLGGWYFARNPATPTSGVVADSTVFPPDESKTAPPPVLTNTTEAIDTLTPTTTSTPSPSATFTPSPTASSTLTDTPSPTPTPTILAPDLEIFPEEGPHYFYLPIIIFSIGEAWQIVEESLGNLTVRIKDASTGSLIWELKIFVDNLPEPYPGKFSMGTTGKLIWTPDAINSLLEPGSHSLTIQAIDVNKPEQFVTVTTQELQIELLKIKFNKYPASAISRDPNSKDWLSEKELEGYGLTKANFAEVEVEILGRVQMGISGDTWLKFRFINSDEIFWILGPGQYGIQKPTTVPQIDTPTPLPSSTPTPTETVTPSLTPSPTATSTETATPELSPTVP